MSEKWYDNEMFCFLCLVVVIIICGGIFISIENFNKSKVEIATIELEKAKIEHGIK